GRDGLTHVVCRATPSRLGAHYAYADSSQFAPSGIVYAPYSSRAVIANDMTEATSLEQCDHTFLNGLPLAAAVGMRKYVTDVPMQNDSSTYTTFTPKRGLPSACFITAHCPTPGSNWSVEWLSGPDRRGFPSARA